MNNVDYTDDELRQMVEPASEELRQALNGILSRHKLEPAAALFVLARITAAYIHQMQKVYNAEGYDEVIEDIYQQMLTSHLTDMEMSNVPGDIGTEKKLFN